MRQAGLGAQYPGHHLHDFVLVEELGFKVIRAGRLYFFHDERLVPRLILLFCSKPQCLVDICVIAKDSIGLDPQKLLAVEFLNVL